MFLADAVAGYVTTLTERELDAPLIALLRSRGFTEVHLLHGNYEFGKDIIGRRVEDGTEYQYCLQSKAGDINAALGRTLRQQVDVMRISNVAHPGFDADLPRRLVVVTNGRLVGGAQSEFQDFNRYHEGRGEQVTEVWDIDTLAPMFYEVLIEGVAVRDRFRTLELLGQLGSGRGSRSVISEYARPWYTPDLEAKDAWGHVLTCAMLSKEAARAAREDLACQLTFNLIRATWEAVGPDAAQRRVLARQVFADVVSDFFDLIRGFSADDIVHSSLSSGTGFSPFVTHPARIGRLCEVLSLGGLFQLLDEPMVSADGQVAAAVELPDVDTLASFVYAITQATPALSHPISDDYAFTLMAACLFLHAVDIDIEPILRDAAIWVLDWTEFGDGLAEPGTSVDEQVSQLLGAPYKPLRRRPRQASYVLTTILDLARLFGFSDLYESLVFDLDAVGAYAMVVVGFPPGPAKLVARLSYAPVDESPGGVPVAAHYAQTANAMPALAGGALFDVLATWATLRDRHVPSGLKAIITRMAEHPDR